MRLSLLLISIFFIGAANSQIADQQLRSLPQTEFQKIAPLVKLYSNNPALLKLTTGAANPMMLANGNKVYALPQDKMPCIVPDVVNNMPNAFQRSLANIDLGKIPNLAPEPKPIFPNVDH